MKIIFNENSRSYVDKLEKKAQIKFNKKYLFKTTPVEMLITADISAIVMLKEEPIIMLIQDKETAESFIAYFNELWKMAKSWP